MSLPRLSISRPVAVMMFFLAVALLGIISFRRLPINLLPDISYPRLVVYTSYPDVAPAEVERFVTEPIEAAVAAVPGVQKLESVSREGVSLVTLRFAWGTDMDFAVLNVREKLDNLRDRLPELAARPVVLRTDPTSEPVMAISVAGKGDILSLKELAEEVFKRRLEQVDGIAQAAISGGLEREIHVEVDPERLQSFGLTVDQLVTALEDANQSAPGGTIMRGRYRYALRTVGEFQSVEEIAAVPITRGSADSTGSVLRLGDIATVTEGLKERESLARYNGIESVGLLLFKEGGANTVRVAERVDGVLDQLRAQYPGVEIDIATSQAGFIRDAISSVVQALVYGGMLAFLVLFLFLRDARYPLAVSLAIPISVVVTFALLDLAGVSLNIMSLGGLALGVGMLVDNSIVVLENVFRHRELGLGSAAAARKGAEEVQGAITASTLTTISVFGPIIYIEGVAGQLFGALSLAVACALAASLLVALTLLPTMAAGWGTRSATQSRSPVSRAVRWIAGSLGAFIGAAFRPLLDRFDRWFEGFARWYHGLLESSLDHRGRVVTVSGGLLLLAVGFGSSLDREVLPDVDQGSFQVKLNLEKGTDLAATREAAERVEREISSSSQVAAVFSRVGRQFSLGGVEDEESGLNTATLDVRLVPHGHTRDAVRDIRRLAGEFPAGVVTVETGQATQLGRLLGSSDADLAVRVSGDNLNEAFRYAQQLVMKLQMLRDIENVRLQSEQGQPEVLIHVNRDKAAVYGIDPSRIARTVERYMRGRTATDYIDFDQRVPIVVRLPDASRRSLATLDRISIDGIPLRELITTVPTLGPAEIRRIDQARTLTVFADVAQGGLDGALQAVSSVIADNPAPRGLRVVVGGENEERNKSFRELAFAFGLAMVLVYMILAAQFESFVHPFTILLSVPLSAVGAAVALWATGAGLNTMSLIGLVILVGIVVNDAIVKVDFINQMRDQGLELRQAILEAGRVRLRPIIMTTVTTVLGLVPMALGIGRGSDLRAPLAIAVIGGLTSATLLTLIIVPVAYDLLEEVRARLRRLVGLHDSRPGDSSLPQASGGA